jgi:hypothetical protein
MLPIYLIEKHLENLNISHDEDGNISHWHIVFFKEVSGRITWMMSRPSIEEIDVTDYIVP